MSICFCDVDIYVRLCVVSVCVCANRSNCYWLLRASHDLMSNAALTGVLFFLKVPVDHFTRQAQEGRYLGLSRSASGDCSCSVQVCYSRVYTFVVQASLNVSTLRALKHRCLHCSAIARIQIHLHHLTLSCLLSRWNGDVLSKGGKACPLRCETLGSSCAPCKLILDYVLFNDNLVFNRIMSKYDKFALTSEECASLEALQGDQGGESLALTEQDLRAMAAYRRALEEL